MIEEFHKAYVLHVRKYTDSRVIVDFFTLNYGRISGVVRVSKRYPALLQAFQPLQVSWRGGSELKTILSCEVDCQGSLALKESKLFCAFYLNEILQRILPLEDSYQDLFTAYEGSLFALSEALSGHEIESILRQFEFLLLSELGFEINFSQCSCSGERIQQESFYRYKVGEGFTPNALEGPAQKTSILLSGGDILAISQQDYRRASTLKAAKQISRQALLPFLGSKPLKSREFFL